MWPNQPMGQFMARRAGLRLYLEVWVRNEWTDRWSPQFLRWLS